MNAKRLALLAGICALPACSGFFPDASSNTGNATLRTPNGDVTISCGNLVDYQSRSANLSGLKVTLPISGVGTPAAELGGAKLDQATSRQASELIQTLDSAQVMYCKGLLLVAPQDRYKVLQDYNTLLISLTTLLRNLAIAATPEEAKAAIAAAANVAATSTDAARSPPAPASAAPQAPAAPPAPAAPQAAAAVGDITRAAQSVASVASTVAATLSPVTSPPPVPGTVRRN